jgi:hypothetical protein
MRYLTLFILFLTVTLPAAVVKIQENPYTTNTAPTMTNVTTAIISNSPAFFTTDEYMPPVQRSVASLGAWEWQTRVLTNGDATDPQGIMYIPCAVRVNGNLAVYYTTWTNPCYVVYGCWNNKSQIKMAVGKSWDSLTKLGAVLSRSSNTNDWDSGYVSGARVTKLRENYFVMTYNGARITQCYPDNNIEFEQADEGCLDGTRRLLNCSIGLATSTDGTNWTKHANNPILPLNSSTNDWDGWQLFTSRMLYHKGTYYLYYTALSRTGGAATGVATSTNVAGPYTRYAGNPNVGASGDPDIIRVGGNTWMLFLAEGGARYISTNLYNWKEVLPRGMTFTAIPEKLYPATGNGAPFSCSLFDDGGELVMLSNSAGVTNGHYGTIVLGRPAERKRIRGRDVWGGFNELTIGTTPDLTSWPVAPRTANDALIINSNSIVKLMTARDDSGAPGWSGFAWMRTNILNRNNIVDSGLASLGGVGSNVVRTTWADNAYRFLLIYENTNTATVSAMSVRRITNGASFTITSSSASDGGNVNWIILQP